MNIKKTLFALFVAVSGLPCALHAGELKIAVEQELPERCITLQHQNYDVIDWSPVVKPQRSNQCGYKSAITGNVINKFLLGEIDKTVAEHALQDESSISQNDAKESFDIDEDALHTFAINKQKIKKDRLTIMATPFNVMRNSFKNGFTVQDLSVGAHDYGTPHIFVVKAAEQSEQRSLQDLASKMGHWVTCVVKENHQKRLQLHYADSLDETEEQRKTIANAHALDPKDSAKLIRSAEQVIREKQQIKEKRRDATTEQLYNIIHGKYPSHSQQDSPRPSLGQSSHNSLGSQLKQLKQKKQQKSWFQRLTSYITPKKLMLTGFCAAGLWLLKTMLNNNNHGATSTLVPA